MLKNALVWFWSLCCLLIIGCGNDTTFTWDEGRTGGELVSIVDDSLAILRNSRGWEECTAVFMGSDDCEVGGDHTGLFLVNYRKKEAPLWGDTLNEKLSLIPGLVGDSTSLFFNKKDQYGFWKVGGSPVISKKWTWSTECSNYQDKYARPWKDGNVLLKLTDQESCPYAVLDTSTGEVQKLEFTGEFAWLEGCDDITYRNGSVICLKAIYADSLYGVHLYRDGELHDSLIWKNASWSVYTKDVIEIQGNMFTIKHPTRMLDHEPNPLNGIIVHSFDPLGTVEPPVRIEYNTFIDSTGSSVYYASEDLFVVK